MTGALPRDFFDRPALEVAPGLLGRTLVRTTPEGEITVRLTEVEAYAGEIDPASHAYRGRTPRNATMYGPPGHAYVYFTYGMWHCLNLVCCAPGVAGAVLIRAGEVLNGAELARRRRPAARRDAELARGPARLATALDIDRRLDGTDVCGQHQESAELRVLPGMPAAKDQVRTGPRTGVSGDGAAPPWRFWIHGDPSVSPYRPHRPRNPRSQLDAGVARS
jgi:DNA-3-methyladenine glycosylase